MKLELHELAQNSIAFGMDFPHYIFVATKNVFHEIYLLAWSCAGATLTRMSDGAEISSPHPFLVGVAHLDFIKAKAFGTTFRDLIEVEVGAD